MSGEPVDLSAPEAARKLVESALSDAATDTRHLTDAARWLGDQPAELVADVAVQTAILAVHLLLEATDAAEDGWVRAREVSHQVLLEHAAVEALADAREDDDDPD